MSEEQNIPEGSDVVVTVDQVVSTLQKVNPQLLDQIIMSIQNQKLRARVAELEAQASTSQSEGAESDDVAE